MPPLAPLPSACLSVLGDGVSRPGDALASTGVGEGAHAEGAALGGLPVAGGRFLGGGLLEEEEGGLLDLGGGQTPRGV